jgi:hypothetical protein
MALYMGSMKVDVNQFGDKAGASGIAITKENPDKMEAVLANATASDVGKIYQYTGETNDKYENGAYYQIVAAE